MNYEALHDSRSTADALGLPIPDAPHAVSVCLPLWQHNVGYEEADPQVVSRMQSGYPRFFLHPLVRKLMAECDARFARDAEQCLAFPSQRAAMRCAEFVRARTGQQPSIHQFGEAGIFAVAVPQPAWRAGLDYWQHAGEIVSSRLAHHALSKTDSQANDVAGSDAKKLIRERIAVLAGASPDDVLLYPTGMAAVFAAYRVFQRLRPNLRSIQFGFPYVDTLKIQQKFGSPSAPAKAAAENVILLPQTADAELKKLESLLADEAFGAIYCEFPCNPLLTSPDLDRLSALARKHETPILVDDTLATYINADVLPTADVTASSLTKYFSGSGDVMGGCLVLNSQSPRDAEIRNRLMEDYEDLLNGGDAIVLEKNSRDFAERVRRINANAERLCDFLTSHPRVARVYYPKYQTAENYRAKLKPAGGCGGLFSIDLHDAPTAAPAFFDRLRICKGPNLGTNFTLCCPYTILAHYQELDVVERCGVSRYLIRVSVGLEDPAWLISRFADALEKK